MKDATGKRFTRFPAKGLWDPYLFRTVKSFMKNVRTYETTEVTEKHSVSSKKADKKAETSGARK